jgi:hypothetical protein
MTIRRLHAAITRLVLVGAMTAVVAVGSVAVGPRHEAAAMPKGCSSLLAAARAHEHTGDVLYGLGYVTESISYYAMAAAYMDSYNTVCP